MRRRFNRGGWRGPGPPMGPFELNKESPQARGLVSWRPMLASWGANVLLDLAHQKHSTFPSTSPAWIVDGQRGAVLDFDGNNDFIDLGEIIDTYLADRLSVSIWIKATGNFSGDYDNVGPIGEWDGNGWIIWTNVGNDLLWELSVKTSGGRSDAEASAQNDNNWHHIVGTFDGQSRIYIDGKLRGTGSSKSGNIASSATNVLLGKYSSTPGREFPGVYDDLRIRNVALTAAEVVHEYHNPYDLYKPILPKFVVVAPAAVGGDLSISVSDSVTVSESVTMEVTSFVDVSDSVSAAEAVTLLIENIISTSDSVSVSEAINLAIAQQIGVSDSVSVTDTPTLMVDENISVSDSVSVSETVTMLETSFVDVSESITVSESVSVSVVDAGTLTISVSDSVSVSEAVTMAVTPLFIDVSDSVSVSESISVSVVTVGTLTISVSDSVTVSEAVVMALTPLLVNVSESVTVADVVTMSLLVGLIDLTLRDRDTSLNLRDRDTSLTLNERY